MPDRGLDYGDGLFETLLLRDGTPQYPDYHLERLERGLKRLRFPDCLARASAQLHDVAQVIASNGPGWAAMRLTVTRGSGPRGYAPPDDARPRILIQVTPLERDCLLMSPPACVAVASLRLSLQPELAGIKHLNRLEHVIASAEAQCTGADEMLLIDQTDRLVSVTSGNLFLCAGGVLLTPIIEQNGIAGTRRRLIIDHWAPAIGVAVKEAALTLEDIAGAQEVFYCNSLQGLRPIARVDHYHWQDHSICEALFQQYRAHVQ